MTEPKLLIVDDDDSIRSQMRWALSKDYAVFEAYDSASALNIVNASHPQVVMLDLGLPPKPRTAEEGLRTLKEILAFDPNIKVIIVSGNTERENALKAIDMGAFDFFTKPPVMDEVRVVIKRAFHMSELEQENLTLQRQSQADGVEGILGNSPAMELLFQSLRKVSTVDVPVLILGESGTGKELTARAIHKLSDRREGPFIVINCGAIPETLLENELFGHEKGAFTSADARKKGKIEYAEGGTLFLDEVGELSLPLQVKLLRFLQEHVIERVGGREEIAVDVRVVAATNRDLKESIDIGKFREDLYFRLSVITLFMPPLRERGDDISLLSRAFLNRFSREFKKPVRGFADDVSKVLNNYNWPGNIRELENRIKRAVVMADTDLLSAADLEFASSKNKSPKKFASLQEAQEALETTLATDALTKNNGNVTHAARELGVSRQTLTAMIRKYGITIREK
ncbi:MAG: PEP-CTERM-box response regulator transcription factor [Nitrospirae bacterium]|nr:PEP-CTERM-box response regulator transcription factor [Nitrospirota bacterium]